LVLPEHCFPRAVTFPFKPRRTAVKKFGYVIAALATIAIAAPSIANAETIVVRHGDMHRDHGWHRDRGWHHHDRMMIIKRGHRHHDM